MKMQFSLSKTIIRMLDVKDAEARGLLWWFIIGSFSFACLSRSLYDLMSYYFSMIPGISKQILYSTNLLSVLLIFSIAAYNIHKKYKESNVIETSVVPYTSPTKRKGLVLLLSTFNDFNKERPLGYAELEELLKGNTNIPEIRKKLFNSNWGPFLYTIDYHSEKLSYVWLVCSTGERGSKLGYNAAKLLIKRIVPACKVVDPPVIINDPNIISESDIKTIRNTYLNCNDYGLSRSDIIYNFTGGTAVMSGLMILATIDDDIMLEYLRRDIDLNKAIDSNGNYISELIDKQGFLLVDKNQYLLSVETMREIVRK